jgi:large subunit ribosomal protein L30e
MAKKTVDPLIREIRNKIAEKKAVLGRDLVLKSLKQDKLQTVFLTSNAPKELIEDINYYADLTNTEIKRINYPNEELGVICQKPFSISILGFLK